MASRFAVFNGTGDKPTRANGNGIDYSPMLEYYRALGSTKLDPQPPHPTPWSRLPLYTHPPPKTKPPISTIAQLPSSLPINPLQPSYGILFRETARLRSLLTASFHLPSPEAPIVSRHATTSEMFLAAATRELDSIAPTYPRSFSPLYYPPMPDLIPSTPSLSPCSSRSPSPGLIDIEDDLLLLTPRSKYVSIPRIVLAEHEETEAVRSDERLNEGEVHKEFRRLLQDRLASNIPEEQFPHRYPTVKDSDLVFALTTLPTMLYPSHPFVSPNIIPPHLTSPLLSPVKIEFEDDKESEDDGELQVEEPLTLGEMSHLYDNDEDEWKKWRDSQTALNEEVGLGSTYTEPFTGWFEFL